MKKNEISDNVRSSLKTAPRNLELLIISDEDNILFKSMREREKDMKDIYSIVSKVTINWDIICEEAKMPREKEILEGSNDACARTRTATTTNQAEKRIATYPNENKP